MRVQGAWQAAEGNPAERWRSGWITRLLGFDDSAWEAALGYVEDAARSAATRSGLSTLERDGVYDRLIDILLQDRMRRIRNLRDPGRLDAYLRIVARRCAQRIAASRHESPDGRRAPLLDAGATASFASEPLAGRGGEGALAAIVRGRAAVSDRQFLVVWLHAVERVSQSRIADALQVTRQAVSRNWATAIARFQPPV